MSKQSELRSLAYAMESMSHTERMEAILDWHNKQVKDPFDYIEPCEPDCSPERHAYHQAQWDMAHRMADLELTTDKLKESSNEHTR